jgi:Sulfatase-modifying factor enzyme 1
VGTRRRVAHACDNTDAGYRAHVAPKAGDDGPDPGRNVCDRVARDTCARESRDDARASRRGQGLPHRSHRGHQCAVRRVPERAAGEACGDGLGGKVGPDNIAPADRALFLEFRSRPSPYTIIDLDDEDARIGVRDGRFAANPGHEDHPATETTWAGALAYCRWRGATPEGLLDIAGSLLEWTSSLDRPYPYRADDGREDLALPGERIVRGGNYIFDDTPDKLVAWNRTVAFRNPATGHRQIGVRCAADSMKALVDTPKGKRKYLPYLMVNMLGMETRT